jgi:hypothetical protein
MGISLSKAKSISGLALVSAVLAGCGGGGGSSSTTTSSGGPAAAPPAGGVTQGSTVCNAVANPETLASSSGALIGSCEQYEASTSPTRAATAFKSPGVNLPVIFSQTTGYEINLPILNGTKTTVPLSNLLTLPGGATAYSFGNFAGKTYQTVLDANSGAAAIVYDYRNTATLTSQKFLDLSFSRFGLFSRFGDRTFGYYGGWAQGDSAGNLPSSTVSFRGSIVGVIGPSSNNTGLGTAAGYSADVAITVNFAAPNAPVTSLVLSNFGYSANGSQISSQVITPVAAGGSLQSSSLDPVVKSLVASFTTAAAGSSSAISEGRLSGNFYGNSGFDVTEFVGTLKFRTADGRNAVGAFGVRSGTSIVNP